MTRLVVLACALAGMAGALYGQQKPPLTPAELFSLAQKSVALPDRCAWKLTFPNGSGEAFPGMKVREIVSVRVGPVQRDTIVWESGAASEAWWIGGDYGAIDPESGNMLFTVARTKVGRLGWIAWISEQNCKGVVSFANQPCAFFEAEKPWVTFWPGYLTPDAEGESQFRLGAYFSVDTGALIAVSLGGAVAQFTWLQPPPGQIAPSKAFADRFKQIQSRVSAKFRR